MAALERAARTRAAPPSGLFVNDVSLQQRTSVVPSDFPRSNSKYMYLKNKRCETSVNYFHRFQCVVVDDTSGSRHGRLQDFFPGEGKW